MATGVELSKDLARTLQQTGGWMVWTSQPLGSIQLSNPSLADVIAISTSYKPTVRIYEVKVSRGDYWADVNRGKYLRYLEHCNQLYFATEAGLIKREEVPQGCGLITRGEKGWHVQIAGRRADCKLSVEFLLALLMKGYQDHWEKMRTLNDDKDWYHYKGLSDAAAKFGKKYAKDIALGQDYLREARELQGKVDEALGKQHSSLDLSIWEIRLEVGRLLVHRKYAEEAVSLTNILMRVFQGQQYNVIEDLHKVIEKLEAKEGGRQ